MARLPTAAMRGRTLAGVLLVAALGAPACGVGNSRQFEEVEASTALRMRAGADARVVQVREPDAPDPPLPDVAVLTPDGRIPPSWQDDPRPVLVLAHDPVAARRLAARLVRDEVPRVAVVRGGVDAWTRAGRPRAAAPTAPAGGKT